MISESLGIGVCYVSKVIIISILVNLYISFLSFIATMVADLSGGCMRLIMSLVFWVLSVFLVLDLASALFEPRL